MRYRKWLWIIIILAFLLRVWTLDTPFYGDENPWPYAADDHSKFGFNFEIGRDHDVFMWTSPPLAPLVYRFFTWFTGVSQVTMRLIPLIIGLINIWLTFILARRLFDSRTALYSAMVMAVSFWHILASFLIEHDSSFLALFWLLFFYSYVLFEDKRKTRYLVFCGISLGLALLTKLTGGLMLIALAIYLLWKHKSVKQPFIACAKILGIGIAVFSVFPVLSLIFNPAYVKETIIHSGVLTLVPSLFSPVRIGIYLLLWATPLLAGLALLSFFDKDRRSRILWVWCASVLGFYLFSRYLGAVDRYMAVMIPALSILAGNVLARRLEFGRIWKVLVAAVPFFVLFVLLNFVPSVWLEHSVKEYVVRAVTLHWGFVFPFHGGGGPAFMTSFVPLGFGILLSAVSFAWVVYAFAKSRPPVQRQAFTLFLAVALAFNLFIVQAFIVKAPYADVGGTTREIVDFAEKENLPLPLFATDMNLGWYLSRGRPFYVLGDAYSDEEKEVERLRSAIEGRGGTLVITDYPKHLKTDAVWELARYCSLKKTFGASKNTVGYVFVCYEKT